MRIIATRWLTVFAILFFSQSSVFAQVDILDEHGKKTGLVNMNPDPAGEQWIAGGFTKEDEQSWRSLPELQINNSPHAASATAAPLPLKVDNSILPQFRPIFTQIGGSCAQACAIGYCFTYEIDLLRGVSAQTEDNQYPYGFTYDFLNQGSVNVGSDINQGWQIIRLTGIPNITDFGSISGGSDCTQWMSGYDKYYRAMFNRTSGTDGWFSINLIPDSGMTKMKRWLFDHGNNSPNGGCLCFSMKSNGWHLTKLSRGPDSGMAVITSMGTSAGHSMTIVGYNDSVYYDIDGNGTISDNEFGGVITVNSWGTSFGNNGKVYVMYDVLRRTSIGGITNQTVMGPYAEKQYTNVKLTYKASITYNKRDSLRITVGSSPSLSATSPTQMISYRNAFNCAGGPYPMCGDGLDSTIEIGLDVTFLLSNLTAGSGKLFLCLSSLGGSGTVNSFSCIDYRSGAAREIPCPQTNVTIQPGTPTYQAVTFMSIILDAVTENNQIPLSPIKQPLFLLYRNSQLCYTIPESETGCDQPVRIFLYDPHGKFIAALVNQRLSAGFYSIRLDPKTMASGTYVCKMEVGNRSTARKIVVR
jgi:hypothetical protein